MPSELILSPRRLSEVASRYGLRLEGPDREIVALGPLSSRSAHRARMLTYVTSERWAAELGGAGIGAAIVPAALAGDPVEGASRLVASGDPEAIFYSVLADTAEAGEWERLAGSVGEGAVIAPSAVIEDGVVIGADCRIMPGAVLLPNTRLGDRVTIKPNATLGGDGFQVREIHGRRRVVPHAGGVEIGDDGMVGSQTCVDRGLFGDFTTVGPGSHVDNLVHVAHSVTIGRDVAVIACAEISGSVTIGDGAWIGPRAAINPSLDLGAHCFIGTGSVVVSDVPAYALAYGSPARAAAWMCACRAKLTFAEDRATCGNCGRAFALVEGQRVHALV